METTSKLELDEDRIIVSAAEAETKVNGILRGIGCGDKSSKEVAGHLVHSNLAGIESHGIMRIMQYHRQFAEKAWRADAIPSHRHLNGAFHEIDGNGGIGIPAMKLAFETATEAVRESGITALAIRNCGHTGCHGAFAEVAAAEGVVTILMGGGNRETWRQVAPHGGTRALLPTNPWCIGVPGDDKAPAVVADFATAQIAGGWIYAARSAGAKLPEGAIIDKDGNPSRDPEDYFNGGAILPAGGHKGYALSLVAELIAEAMLGPVEVECHWLLIAIDAGKFSSGGYLGGNAAAILEELRTCPPAPGYRAVEIPGEREARHRAASKNRIAIPRRTWEEICALG